MNAASSPSATRSPTAAASSSGASRCSRGRCGWRAGSGCLHRLRGRRRARRRTSSTQQIPAFAQRTALPDARYDVGCLYIGVNDVRALRLGRGARSRPTTRGRCAFLRRALRPRAAGDDPGGPRAPARGRDRRRPTRSSSRPRRDVVLDLRGFGARNLVMTDHVHPTAFGQVWIAERALEALGMDVRVRPSTLIHPGERIAAARAAGRLDLRLPGAQGAAARLPRWRRAELLEPLRHVAIAQEQQQAERRQAHGDRGRRRASRPARSR